MKITPQFIADSQSLWDGLSPRLRQVARLVASGLTYNEVAEEVGTSPKTINHQMSLIKDRLRCERSEIGIVTLAAIGLLREGEL